MNPADRENTPSKAALASVMEKFPDARAKIRELFLRSPSFQSLCEDYRDSLAAWQYWRQAASKEAPALCQSYAELLQELDQEVRQYLEEEQSSGFNASQGIGDGLFHQRAATEVQAKKRASSTLRLRQRHPNHGGSMKNRQSTLVKVLSLLVMVALPLMAFSSPALAQKAQELKDAHKMMADGWKMYNDGQRMVIKGKEMNDLVAVQMGFQDKMVQGDKIIQDGRNTQTQAATLFAKGEKTFMENLKTPSVAKTGLKMMQDAFKIADDGGKMIEKGMLMNNKVAEGAGAIEKFAQGNQVINDGRTTMARGAQLFMQGEALFLKLK